MKRSQKRKADARRLGPQSAPHTLAKLDQRTREAAFMRRIRNELTEHVGGRPTAPQRLLIERLVVVALRLQLYDRKMTAGEVITDHDGRVFAGLHTAYRLMLRELDKRPAAAADKPLPSLADLFPGRTAA